MRSGFAAIDQLRSRGHQPSRPIGVVNFVDEEGARFGVACAGSRLITGALSPDRALGLTDADGLTLANALTRAGRSAVIGPDPDALRRIAAFVELHVEQGRALALLDPAHSAIAVGTGIWPHGRWRIEVTGEANHAGTTRLVDRDDALLKAAEIIAAARSIAAEHGCVATIGRLQVHPNGINAVPSHVTAHLDARGADGDAVRAVVAALTTQVETLGGVLRPESWTETTTFHHDLTGRVRTALDAGPSTSATPTLGTGAGHDAGILAQAGILTTMLFVRNPTGISHSPAEHADLEDCHAGVEALTHVVADLTGPEPLP